MAAFMVAIFVSGLSDLKSLSAFLNYPIATLR